LQGMFLISRVI